MKRVLLTGAGGFIGRHAIAPLLARGFEVHAVDVRDISYPGCVSHVVDLADAGATRHLTETVRPSHLLHFAWYVKPGEFWTSPDNVRWVQRSLELLLAFTESGGQRSVMAGTCAEYDSSGEADCVEDLTPLRPSTLYGECKAALYAIQKRFALQVGISAAWGRVFHLYGPHEAPGRLIPSVIRSLLLSEPARCSPGTQIRDFLHVSDVASAFVNILDTDLEGAVNIGSGEPKTIADAVRMTAALIERPELVQLGALPLAANDPARLVPDISRLRSTGFQPRYSLNAGLKDVIQWWRDQVPVLG